MNHYKELNKELVGQLQAMRVNVKLYCDEIVRLKEELMQKRESEVILRKQCYNWAVKNFLQLIQNVQPDSDILPILEKYVIPQERRESQTNRINQRQISERGKLSNEDRRSSQLLLELRRSNSIIQTRRSVYSTSPLRSNEVRDQEENKEEESERAIQNLDQNDFEQPKSGFTQPENQQENLRNTEVDNIIYEDYEEDDDSSLCESVEEVSVDISHTKTTLKDVTNTLSNTLDISKGDNSENLKTSVAVNSNICIRGRYKKRTTQLKFSVEDKENMTDEHVILMELDDSQMDQRVTINRRRHENERSRLTDYTFQDIEEDTVPEPRILSNAKQLQATNRSIPITQDYNSCQEEVISPSCFDLTLRNFKQVASSTPNSRCNSLRHSQQKSPISLHKQSPTLESTSTTTITTNSSSRPSRQCKPKNLSEPKLGTKLRNESSATIKRNSRKKL